MDEGFADWTRKDFRSFTSALEQYGRNDRENIFRQVSHETGKPEHDVEAYFEAFEKNAETNLAEWAKIVEKIEKGERKIKRQAEIKNALDQKVRRDGVLTARLLLSSFALHPNSVSYALCTVSFLHANSISGRSACSKSIPDLDDHLCRRRWWRWRSWEDLVGRGRLVPGVHDAPPWLWPMGAYPPGNTACLAIQV